MTNETTEASRPDWLPQQHQADGVHLTGKAELPANHRLRAEALVDRGDKSDPDGIISDELIADTADRLEREAAAAAAPGGKPLAEQSLAQLRATAKAEKVPRYGLIKDEARLREVIEAHRAATAPPPAVETTEKAAGDPPAGGGE